MTNFGESNWDNQSLNQIFQGKLDRKPWIMLPWRVLGKPCRLFCRCWEFQLKTANFVRILRININNRQDVLPICTFIWRIRGCELSHQVHQAASVAKPLVVKPVAPPRPTDSRRKRPRKREKDPGLIVNFTSMVGEMNHFNF